MALRKKQRLDRKPINTHVPNEAPIISQPQEQQEQQEASPTTSQAATSFQRPLTMIENLEGAVQSTLNMNATLKRSLALLTSVTQDLKRQEVTAQHVRIHHIATLSDIENLRRDFARDTKPDTDQALDGVVEQLVTLTQREADLTNEVENQEKYVKELKANMTVQQQQKKKRPSNPTPADASELAQERQRKQKLLEMHKQQDEKIAKEEEAINELKAVIFSMTSQMEAALEANMGEEILQKRQQDLENDLVALDNRVDNRKEELKRRTEKDESMKSNTSEAHVHHINKGELEIIERALSDMMSKYQTIDSKGHYEDALKLFTSVIEQINQPEFMATVSIIHDCDGYGKKYHQAIQTEKIYLPVQDKEKQEQLTNEQVKQLSKTLIPNHIESKTASRIIELILTNGGKISVQQLLEEFPSAIEKRHNLTKVTLLLFQANLLKISGTDLIINDPSSSSVVEINQE